MPEASTGREPDEAPSVTVGQDVSGWPAALGLVATIVGAIGFAVSFALGASSFWYGGLLALALLGIGVALAYWGRDLAGDEIVAGPYPLPPSVPPDDQAALGDDLDEDVQVITRRRFLKNLLIGGVGVFGISQIVLLSAFGPRPRRKFVTTFWAPDTRLVTFDGTPITRDTLALGAFLVAWPEGHTDDGNSQVALLHLPTPPFAPLAGRESWSPEGFVAYSRVCTHAGCAVAQYEDEAQVLACPCHQSAFDVLHGARPVAGPAGKALPQLPLTIDAAGYLRAQGDFSATVGPGYWNQA